MTRTPMRLAIGRRWGRPLEVTARERRRCKCGAMTAAQWIVSVIVLAIVGGGHLLAPVVTRSRLPQDRIASFAGGASVAFVFIHLLPELADDSGVLEDLGVAAISPLQEVGMFGVAMIGMVAFYVLDVGAADGFESPRTAYRAHLAAFALLNFLFMYTTPDWSEAGIGFSIVFAIVMSLHFLLTDRTLARSHPEIFDRRHLAFITVSLVAGLLAAQVVPPPSPAAVVLPSAFIGGSLLMTTFREELPEPSSARLSWFGLGLGLFSVLLVVLTWQG